MLIYRFRDEHAADPDVGPGEWISRTTAIGDRAVFISGSTVAATMVGLSLSQSDSLTRSRRAARWGGAGDNGRAHRRARTARCCTPTDPRRPASGQRRHLPLAFRLHAGDASGVCR